MSAPPSPSAVEAMRAWCEDACLFVEQVLGATPDDWQREVLAEISAGRMRIALKASKGPGKSTLLAWILWWWLFTKPRSKVVATSITGDNLRDGLWAEAAKWQAKSPVLQALFSWSAERISANEAPEEWFASARQWAKAADASQQANTLAGIHADHLLFLVDESGGIPDAVVAAAEAGLANVSEAEGRTALLVLAGNPTHLSGPLYRACTRERALWWVKEISGDPDDPKRAPRISIEWAREQIAKYGRDNPWVLINVFGKFPPGQSNALLGVEEVTEATRRVLGERDYVDEVKVLGVDVARFGDDRSVLFMRQGRVAFRPTVLRNLDTMALAGQVALVIDKHQPDATFVDVVGVGAGVVDRLLQLGYPVIGVDSGASPIEGERFLNLRAEMWWKLAEWVKGGACLPDDAELISEATAPTYTFSPDNRLVLESKKDMKKRGLPSPDKADALAFTFAQPVAHRELRHATGAAPQSARRDYDPHERS